MMNVAYEVTLIAHSFTRWGVLVACVLAALHALSRLVMRQSWTVRDQGFARVFVGSVDLQLLLGLSLYFGFSPLARAARALWSSEGCAELWAQRQLFFFGVIHPSLALLAALVAHASWVLARRAPRDSERHRWVASGAALALALFLAAIPWPFLGHERPWLRF
jgi:hypothetical protein